MKLAWQVFFSSTACNLFPFRSFDPHIALIGVEVEFATTSHHTFATLLAHPCTRERERELHHSLQDTLSTSLQKLYHNRRI
jgi:hypothetical protein